MVAHVNTCSESMILASKFISWRASSVAGETIVNVIEALVASHTVVRTMTRIMLAARVLMSSHILGVLVIDFLINEIVLIQDDLMLFDSSDFLVDLG